MDRIIVYLLISILFLSCNNNPSKNIADYNIVPRLQQVVDNGDRYFKLKNTTFITYNAENEKLASLAGFLSDYLFQLTGMKLEIKADAKVENAIYLISDFEYNNPEAYQIKIEGNGVIINGASEAGTFYGIQSLRKSMPLPTGTKQDVWFPYAEITDYPVYQHRGVHLDVSRHFFPVEFIKKYLDVLALYNMNVFHWHLTDDQGWRIEIKKYPKLTETGSKRNETVIGRHTNQFDGKPHSGFYTQEEIKEIIEYAADRYITVIPEIDIPGHTLAVLASYPELGCTGGPYEVGREWGIYEDVLCVGNENVFIFLEDVLKEVMELFPAQYIHIGGDECLKHRWSKCSKCQARIKQLELKETRQHTLGEQLQSYFIKRVEQIINAGGKSIIGWDEILEGGIAPNATIMSWRGTDGGIYAASKGHDVIMTPEEYVYLDYYQSPDVDNESFRYGWLTELKKIYAFDPMPAELSEDKRMHILGAQVNVWTEYIPTSDQVEYMLLPRMCALSETVWSNPQQKDYNGFVRRLYKQSKLLDHLGYTNSKQAYQIQEEIIVDTLHNELKVQLSTFDNSPIYYSLGSDVSTINSKHYTKPILIDKDTEIKAITIRDNEESNVYSSLFTHHKALAKPISLVNLPDKKYTFSGADILINGKEGVKNSYRTGSWLGFLGTDLEAVIDLKDKTIVSSVEINAVVNTRGSVFGPRAISVLTSDDGNIFKKVYQQFYPEIFEHISPKIVKYMLELNKEQQARYLKVHLESLKKAPNWHEKRGEEVYLMIDEIKVH